MSEFGMHVPDANRTFGIQLVCSFFSTVIFGLTSHQAFRYFRMFPLDPLLLNGMVTCLWGLNSLNTILIMHENYIDTVTYFLNPTLQLDIVWSAKVSMLISGVMACATRIFFAQRVHKLAKYNMWTSIPIGSAALLRFGTCVGMARSDRNIYMPLIAGYNSIPASVVTISVLSQTWFFSKSASWAFRADLAFAAATDTYIALVLCYYVHIDKRGFTSHDSPFDRALVYTANTGVFPSLLSLAAFICSFSAADKAAPVGLIQLAGGLYVNSFMTVLNCRKSTFTESQVGSLDLRVDKSPTNAQHVVNILVTHETHTVIDTPTENRGKEIEDTSDYGTEGEHK